MLSRTQKKKLEEKELVEESGHETESRGIKAINKLFKDTLISQQLQEANFQEQLQNKKHYRKTLVTALNYYLDGEQLDKDVTYTVGEDGKGIIMLIGCKGRIFQRAFAPSGITKYDLQACQRFAVSASSLITKLKDGTNKPQFQTVS